MMWMKKAATLITFSCDISLQQATNFQSFTKFHIHSPVYSCTVAQLCVENVKKGVNSIRVNMHYFLSVLMNPIPFQIQTFVYMNSKRFNLIHSKYLVNIQSPQLTSK